MTTLQKLSAVAIFTFFAILPLSAQAELESIFINVSSYYDDINSVENIVSGIDGVSDSYSNNKKKIITVLFDGEKTTKEDILSKISSMGYGIQYKSQDNQSQLFNVKYQKIELAELESVKADLQDNPYVLDFYFNPKNNIMSIIYAESSRDRGVVYHNINPLTSGYSVYMDKMPKKFLNKE